MPYALAAGAGYVYGALSDDGLTWTKAAIIAASAAVIIYTVKRVS